MERGGTALERHVEEERSFAAAKLAGTRGLARGLLAEMLSQLPSETVCRLVASCERPVALPWTLSSSRLHRRQQTHFYTDEPGKVSIKVLSGRAWILLPQLQPSYDGGSEKVKFASQPQETVPERFGEFEYWTRQTAAAPRVALLRRRAGGGHEEVVLDSNLLPEDSELGQARAGQPNPLQMLVASGYMFCVKQAYIKLPLVKCLPTLGTVADIPPDDSVTGVCVLVPSGLDLGILDLRR